MNKIWLEDDNLLKNKKSLSDEIKYADNEQPSIKSRDNDHDGNNGDSENQQYYYENSKDQRKGDRGRVIVCNYF